MRRLYLLRHADAASQRPGASDHDRPLTDRGREEASRLGRFMARIDAVPDRILSSDAVRARETAECVAAEWELDVPMRLENRLYRCRPEDVLDEIRVTSESAPSLLLVGHQPTWGQAIQRLAGKAQVRVPTGTCACLRLPSQPWADLRFGYAELEWLVPPRLTRAL